ncbi:hypothetical protein BP5796_06644 [Coleophoma crateriformis]|uniref:Uncharacterized protein n=1 Tax=Coleophoma crateriformis TaxID=565419 RepID=A0A3D8RP45_9HELO|nr:hypothetical protein BP5796_06644 [Coleophoma crateriformis]
MGRGRFVPPVTTVGRAGDKRRILTPSRRESWTLPNAAAAAAAVAPVPEPVPGAYYAKAQPREQGDDADVTKQGSSTWPMEQPSRTADAQEVVVTPRLIGLAWDLATSTHARTTVCPYCVRRGRPGCTVCQSVSE